MPVSVKVAKPKPKNTLPVFTADEITSLISTIAQVAFTGIGLFFAIKRGTVPTDPSSIDSVLNPSSSIKKTGR